MDWTVSTHQLQGRQVCQLSQLRDKARLQREPADG